MKRRILLAAAATLAVATTATAARRPANAASQAPAPGQARIPLGRRLFYDADLSRDGTMACATCHEQH